MFEYQSDVIEPERPRHVVLGIVDVHFFLYLFCNNTVHPPPSPACLPPSLFSPLHFLVLHIPEAVLFLLLSPLPLLNSYMHTHTHTHTHTHAMHLLIPSLAVSLNGSSPLGSCSIPAPSLPPHLFFLYCSPLCDPILTSRSGITLHFAWQQKSIPSITRK